MTYTTNQLSSLETSTLSSSPDNPLLSLTFYFRNGTVESVPVRTYPDVHEAANSLVQNMARDISVVAYPAVFEGNLGYLVIDLKEVTHFTILEVRSEDTPAE